MPMKNILFLKEIFLILMEPIHMQLSYKQKIFSGIFFFFFFCSFEVYIKFGTF